MAGEELHALELFEVGTGRLGGAYLADVMLYCRNRIYPLGLPNGISHFLAAILGLFAIIFGVVNALVKPLFVFASAPLLLLTLGLFLLVINSLLLWLTSWIADQLNLGWHVDGFWSAFWGALIVSVVSFILNSSFISKSEVNR